MATSLSTLADALSLKTPSPMEGTSGKWFVGEVQRAYREAARQTPLFPSWSDWDVVTRFEKLHEWLRANCVPAVSQEQNYRLRVIVMARRSESFTLVEKRPYLVAAKAAGVPQCVAENGSAFKRNPPVSAYATFTQVGPYRHMDTLRKGFTLEYESRCPALRWYDKVKVETRMEPTGCSASTETEQTKEAREARLRTLAKRLAWEDDVMVVQEEARKA